MNLLGSSYYCVSRHHHSTGSPIIGSRHQFEARRTAAVCIILCCVSRHHMRTCLVFIVPVALDDNTADDHDAPHYFISSNISSPHHLFQYTRQPHPHNKSDRKIVASDVGLFLPDSSLSLHWFCALPCPFPSLSVELYIPFSNLDTRGGDSLLKYVKVTDQSLSTTERRPSIRTSALLRHNKR